MAWLVGYITPKNSWLIKWIKFYKLREQGHHVQNTDVLKRDDEKYCKLLVLRPTSPQKNSISKSSKQHPYVLPTY